MSKVERIRDNYNKLRELGVSPELATVAKFWSKKRLIKIFKQLEALNMPEKIEKIIGESDVKES